jgi:hypothetical protein
MYSLSKFGSSSTSFRDQNGFRYGYYNNIYRHFSVLSAKFGARKIKFKKPPSATKDIPEKEEWVMPSKAISQNNPKRFHFETDSILYISCGDRIGDSNNQKPRHNVE